MVFENSLPRASTSPQQRNKPLLRASSLALGKEIFRVFSKKSLPGRALGKGPLFAALVIALGKDTTTTKENYNNKMKQLA
jgi:hypothetical protein